MRPALLRRVVFAVTLANALLSLEVVHEVSSITTTAAMHKKSNHFL
jgi:hypothetical protein